jgi:lysophospholipase L1-like esterase
MSEPVRGAGYWLKRLALLACALCISLLVGELLVRWLVKVRNVGPSFTVAHGSHGKQLKRSFSCWRITPEFTMKFSTNSLGFRGPEPASFPKRGILFLGDSFTMGYGVSDGEEFPALVAQAMVSKSKTASLPVINAGMGATGNGRWVKFLRDEAPQYEPRAIVLQFCSNDFDDNQGEGMFTLESAVLQEHPERVDSRAKRAVQTVVEAIPGLAYSHLLGLLRQTGGGGATVDGPAAGETVPDVRLTCAILQRAVSICRERNWPVLVLMADLDGSAIAALKECCQRIDVPVLEVPSKKERPDLYYRLDGHWNQAGHRYGADLVLKWLTSLKLISDDVH